MRTSVATAVAVIFAAAAPVAHGSARPTKPVFVDVAHGSIGGTRLGDPILKFWKSWRQVPDYIVTHPAGPLAVWQPGERVPSWAAARFDDAEEHAASIFYSAPLRTARGDRQGTPLATFLRHWPSHGAVHAAPNYPRCSSVAVANVRFFFDAKRRLFAVAVGDDTALGLYACNR